jgi:YD repeat-containing protein
MLGAALVRLDVRRSLVVLLTLSTILLGPNGLLTNLPVVHAQTPLTASKGKPNRFNPSQDAQSIIHLPPGGHADPTWKPSAPQPIPHPTKPPMDPGFLTLTLGQPALFVGDDGRLEVDVPGDAITSSDQRQAGGTLRLLVTQIAPASGSTAGGSGLISLGTYLLQLVDVHGKRVGHGLRVPITLKYHYTDAEIALNLDHAFVVFNAPLPRGVQVAPAAVANTPALGTHRTQKATLNVTAHTLSVTATLLTPSASMSWDTDAPVATFGKPDIFNANLNAGALSASYPLELPAGPGGLTPPLTLAYSSAGVSENHDVQSAAGWVGEGWTLSPGSVSWAEHNVLAGGTGGPLWENSWQLSDPYGTSAELIPPNLNISSYYDDAGNPTSGLYESYQSALWSSSSFTWSAAKWLSGDFNGDGKADLVAAYNLGSTVGFYEWQSTGSGLTSLGNVFTTGGFTWASAKWVAGDFNGDGKTDLAAAYDLGNGTIGLYEWQSTGSSFTSLGSLWRSGSFCLSCAQWAAGDIDGDHQADLVALYDLGTEQGVAAVALYEWFSTGSSFASQGQVWTSIGRGAFSFASAAFLAGNVSGDGHADLLAPYDLGSGATAVNAWFTNWTYISSPISWQTAPDMHVKIFSYWGPNNLSGGVIGPLCFRVFLKNGIMEEFGCTPDSLQYYYQLSGTNTGKPYVSNWLLDLITDPAGNQIHFTYQADMATDSGGHSYPRDIVLSTVEWDSPGCHDAQQRCTGASWAPLLRVSFSASHTPTRFYPGTGPTGTCNRGTHLRCDDPKDLSPSGQLAPQVQSTFVLNDIQVQVNSSGTWNTLKDYQLSYEQSGPTTITDPQTSEQESTAGMLDLTRITAVGDDGTTQEPPRTFSYTSQPEHYEDDAFPAPAGNCGPAWNTGCLMWSQSYDGNSRYLASVSNGLGLYQTFTWKEARNNTHGVNGGGSNNANPLYCDGKESQGYPCNQADDQVWSHIVLTQEDDSVVRLWQSGQGGQQSSKTIDSQTVYTYLLTYPLAAQACADCVAGMYWGNQNDADYLDYYNAKFMGFTQASVSHPDGSLTVHKYYATKGWGLYDAPGTAPNYLTCYAPNPCHADPWWDPGNALHGHEFETDQYDTDGTTLLSKTTTQYSVTCPPSGVSGTGSTSYGNFDGNLVSELDHNNPVAACDIQTSQVDDYTSDGSTASGVPHKTTTYQYDSYGRVTQTTTTSNDGGATGSPTTIITKTSYVWNDAVSVTPASATGTYLIDFPAFTDTEDTSGNRYSCSYTSYDGQAYATGQQSGLTLGEATTVDQYTNCGTKANNFTDQSGLLRTNSTYDVFGNLLTTTDPDANAGISGHTGCTPTGGSGTYTTCTNYDTTFHALPVSSANALNQTASIGYTQSAAGGFGLWPTSTTDVNGQTTTMTYDGLGRPTSQTLPGETSGLTTTTTSYTIWCTAGSAQSPCVEIDSTQRLNSTTTITVRAFYDGFGRLVETRTPGPNNQDVVCYRYYDPSGRDVNDSIQYFVAAYTGGPGAAAYSIPDGTQPGTSASYPSHLSGSVTDALSNTATESSSVICSPSGVSDTACYVQRTTIDPLGHKQSSFTDALGREIYDQRYTGNSPSTYAVYATTQYTYDYRGDLTQILHPDGATKTTFQYDMVGRQTGMTDPDRGTESYVYDADGNATQVMDARGGTGTIYAGYDGLNRQLWRNTTNSPTGAYVTYSYDSTANGNHGVGRLTGESFTGGPNQSLSGSYSTVYDVRGQVTQATLTVGGTNYPIQASYNDAGQMLTQTYPNGDVLTTSYTLQGWLAGLTLQQGSTQITLLSNLSYTGTSGAAGLPSSASLNGGTYTQTASYDLLLRPTDTKVTRSSDQATLFEESDTYDSASRVTGVTTTLSQGADVQQFCYDEQNRLTWAGSVGTPPCTGTAIAPGSLTSAQ